MTGSIPEIIEACAKAGVIRFKWSDLEIIFQESLTSIENPVQDSTRPELNNSPRQTDPTEAEHFRTESLKILDPLAYEDELIQTQG